MLLIETSNSHEYGVNGGERHSVENQRILSRLVEREVLCCVSSLVSHFAQHSECCSSDGISEDEIMELCSMPDWETAGRYHIGGMDWDELMEFCNENQLYKDCEAETPFDESDIDNIEHVRNVVIDEAESDWQEFCQDNRLDPDQIEAYEHWAVTGWFAARLKERGEMVGDFFDLIVWGRCTTGQSISLDGVIAEIAAEMQILVGQKNEWKE